MIWGGKAPVDMGISTKCIQYIQILINLMWLNPTPLIVFNQSYWTDRTIFEKKILKIELQLQVDITMDKVEEKSHGYRML